MCHRKEPIGAMQIVQKDISENLHIRDVGLYAVKLGREDSDAPPQGGLVTRGDKLKSQSGRCQHLHHSKPIFSCKLIFYCLWFHFVLSELIVCSILSYISHSIFWASAFNRSACQSTDCRVFCPDVIRWCSAPLPWSPSWQPRGGLILPFHCP